MAELTLNVSPKQDNNARAGLPSPLTLLVDLTVLDFPAVRGVTLTVFWPSTVAVFWASALVDFFGLTLTVLSESFLPSSPADAHKKHPHQSAGTHSRTANGTNTLNPASGNKRHTVVWQQGTGTDYTIKSNGHSLRMVCACCSLCCCWNADT